MQQKYLLSLLGCLLFHFQTYSQDLDSYIPPSPNATALAKFANIPVSLYTGTPQINIPLYQIQSRSLSVPISLSYHASGIKVQDIASSVGTGWALNAGGIITRVVRGLPDEYDNGYCGKNQIGKKADDPLSNEYTNKVRQGIWDAEPDLFYFNFMGRTGRFILNASGEPIIFPQQPIQITPAIGLKGKQLWTITTEDGNVYTFGKSTYTQEQTIYITPEGQASPPITTSWYLEKVVDANQLDEISFDYETAGDLEYTYYRQTAQDVSKTQAGLNSAFCANEANKTTLVKDVNTQIKVKNSLWLKAINHSRGSVKFKHYFTRADLKNAGSLALIEILDEKGKRIKAYDFDYWFTNLGNASERMFLEQIKEIGGIIDYELLAYSFVYNQTVNLPARNSHQIDHWGYYNSNAYPSKIPAITFENKDYAGADKNPDPVRVQANILTQINYITGGSTKFIYESNTYGLLNKKAGGVRVKQVIESDGMDESKDIIKNYAYTAANNPAFSSGQIFRLPIYHHATYNTKKITVPPNNNVIFCREDYLMRSSHSYADLFDMNGSHIGYSHVTVTLPDKSKMIHTFTNFNDFPDLLAEKISYISPEENTPILPNEPPFAPSTFRGWRRGLPLEEAVYDGENRIQKKITYSYIDGNQVYPKTSAWIAYIKGNTQNCIGQCSDFALKTPTEYIMARYEILTEAWLLKQKIEETYDQGQIEKKATQTTQYAYNDYLQLREQIQYVAGDDKRYITEFKYCTDYLAPYPKGDENLWAYALLFEKGIIAQPLEIIQHSQTIKDEPLVTLGATLNLFKIGYKDAEKTQMILLPARILGFKATNGILDFNFAKVMKDPNPNVLFSLNYDPRYDTLVTFDQYDLKGYLLEKTTQDGTKSYYQWSYKSLEEDKLLVAESINHPILFFNDFESQYTIKSGREGSKGGEMTPQQTDMKLATIYAKPKEKHVFSCWVKAESVGNLWIIYKNNLKETKIDSVSIPIANTQGEFVYVEKLLEVPVQPKLNMTAISLHADQTIIVDDILLHLTNTPVKTYIYELPFGVKAVTDAEKQVLRSTYDARGRVEMLLDDEKNILGQYEYNYVEDK